MGLNHTSHPVLATIDAAAILARTESWCAINSGTSNLSGLARMAHKLAEAFAALPGQIELVDPAPVTTIAPSGEQTEQPHGQHLVLRVRPDAPRRVLLTGHMDTVYPPDHPFQAARWLDAETLNAPAAADMKGGLAIMLEALLAFERSPEAATLGYDVMINSDEETGSLASAALIADLARGKLAALTYEPATAPDGTLAHARGGSGNYSVVAAGRSAHAGRNPQDGRNALLALADLALRLKQLTHADLSVNPARIDGGSANNVVPDHAVLRFNIRPRTVRAAEDFARSFAALLADIAAAHEVTLTPHGGITRPPKPVDARAQALFDLVQQAGADLGQHFGWRPSGGVCDGNNIAAVGVPVVDTMGARGGAIHSPEEYLIVPSLAERARLSTLVLLRLATGALA
ncbi:hydrolase [Croceibacterium sp. TMG7-5b_MA50]|uniref:hydrolase n=1 Tax=Croceibacterium sp. TMG7-5b_MA50 TaxID=3121290 RepID=UPI00322192A3